MSSLAEALPKEIERVQDMIRLYMTIPTGIFAAELMKRDIRTALDAIMEGDLVKMVAAYEALKGHTL